MNINDIKVDDLIVLNNGIVGVVLEKRRDHDFDVVDIKDSEGDILTVTPPDINRQYGDVNLPEWFVNISEKK